MQTERTCKLVTVQLMKSYCLPFILSASEAISLSATNIRVLGSRPMYNFFGVHVCFFFKNSPGLPNLSRLIDGRARKFMDRLFENCDFTVVLNVFVCNLSYVHVHVCVYTAFCVCVFLVVS